MDLRTHCSYQGECKCITMKPAEILGIENRVGALEVGKDADVVLWSGHPFEFYSRVEQVFINGEPVTLG